MISSWYLDNSDADQREPHKPDPPQMVGVDSLKALGILHWKFDIDNLEAEGRFDQVKKERNYTFDDIIPMSKERPDYEKKIKCFFKEHIHADREIRLIMDGSGYWDVRDKTDTWIRIEAKKGDMLAIPGGLYHRFTLDTKDFITVMRLYSGEPIYTPIYRPADDHPQRKAYLQSLEKGSWSD